ncbi:MAG: hypothetical protein Q9199_000845 [Rusavskia elegans]
MRMERFAHATANTCMTAVPSPALALLRQRESSKMVLFADPVPWPSTTQVRDPHYYFARSLAGVSEVSGLGHTAGGQLDTTSPSATPRCVFHYHDPRRGNRILAQSLDGGVNGHRVKACCLPERRERREPDQLPNEAAKTRWKDPRSSSGKPWRRLSLMWYRYSDLLRLHSLVPSVRKQPYPM